MKVELVHCNNRFYKERILGIVPDASYLEFGLGTDLVDIWIGQANGKDVAVIITVLPYFGSAVAYIPTLIAPKGTDVYTQLLQKAEQWARANGAKQIILHTKSRRSAEKRGYKFMTTVMRKELYSEV